MKRIIVGLVFIVGLLAIPAIAQFTEWSAPVNMGPVLNSKHLDQCVTVSKDGLTLIFSSNRDSNTWWGTRDLYVSKRVSTSEPWGTPQVLPNVNSPYDESCPALGISEHELYFASMRPGGCGGSDFYVSHRNDRRDDFGWEAPVNLGCESEGYVNTSRHEQTPTVFEDEDGNVVMYFTSGANLYNFDIYASYRNPDGTFGPGAKVSELSAPYPYGDLGPAVRRDGLEIIYASFRPGGMRDWYWDLWTATRKSTKDPWSQPVNLTILNTKDEETGRMCFSYDGLTFYFASDRRGGSGHTDLYFTTREKLKPQVRH